MRPLEHVSDAAPSLSDSCHGCRGGLGGMTLSDPCHPEHLRVARQLLAARHCHRHDRWKFSEGESLAIAAAALRQNEITAGVRTCAVEMGTGVPQYLNALEVSGVFLGLEGAEGWDAIHRQFMKQMSIEYAGPGHVRVDKVKSDENWILTDMSLALRALFAQAVQEDAAHVGHMLLCQKLSLAPSSIATLDLCKALLTRPAERMDPPERFSLTHFQQLNSVMHLVAEHGRQVCLQVRPVITTENHRYTVALVCPEGEIGINGALGWHAICQHCHDTRHLYGDTGLALAWTMGDVCEIVSAPTKEHMHPEERGIFEDALQRDRAFLQAWLLDQHTHAARPRAKVRL